MKIQDFFAEHPRVALAFSGGVDSTYLLYLALTLGCDVKAYYVKSPFQPEFELEDAMRAAEELNAPMRILEVDVLGNKTVCSNPANRCYYCKQEIFSNIIKAAGEDGYSLIIDGTNASDDAADRPGMQALREMAVRSPLRECGVTKEEVRRRSREAGLFTWNKPAYACLATRIPVGTEITEEKLRATENAEAALFAMGFSDFRVRMLGEAARIQVPKAQLEKLLNHRKEVLESLKPYYSAVTLDLETREGKENRKGTQYETDFGTAAGRQAVCGGSAAILEKSAL